MSERMTDDEVGKHLGTAIAASDPGRRSESAVALSKEIARAHTSEDQKDATIKALADAMKQARASIERGNNLSAKEYLETALRLAGRL